MPDEDNGLRITLKDLYQGQTQIEKRLADAFGELKITLTKIQSHLDNVEQRNSAADQLHKEYGRRLAETERVIEAAGVRTLREDRARMVSAQDDQAKVLEERVRRLEESDSSNAAIASVRQRSRQVFWAMMTAVAALAGVVATVLVEILRHAT